jgi:hypothetical protein
MSDNSGDDMPVDSDLDTDHRYHPAEKVLLVKQESKQPMDKSEVLSSKTMNNCSVGHISVKTYLRYKAMEFTIDADKIDCLGGSLEGQARF